MITKYNQVEAKPAVPRGSQGQMGNMPAPGSHVSGACSLVFRLIFVLFGHGSKFTRA